MRLRSWLSILFALAALLFITGCERGGAPFVGEDSEPNFERGKQLIRQGRQQEALSAFLKVISRRGDEAPESHLEAGLIYQGHIKDHLAAIYHFRKYLELQPNSRQADLVNQRIKASMREFSRTLNINPLEDRSVKLGFMDQLDRLTRENEQLKAEISALRAGLPTGPSSYSRSGFEIPIASSSAPVNKTVDDAGSQAVDSSSPVSRAPIVVQTPAEPTVSASPASSMGGRKHVIGQGDTLYILAQKYYGNRSRWREIFQANRDQLKTENDKLRIGQELKIP